MSANKVCNKSFFTTKNKAINLRVPSAIAYEGLNFLLQFGIIFLYKILQNALQAKIAKMYLQVETGGFFSFETFRTSKLEKLAQNKIEVQDD